MACIAIAVETIEFFVATIDIDGCECGFVRRDRRLVDNFSGDDFWS